MSGCPNDRTREPTFHLLADPFDVETVGAFYAAITGKELTSADVDEILALMAEHGLIDWEPETGAWRCGPKAVGRRRST